MQAADIFVPHWPLPVDAAAHGPALDRHLLLNLWIAVGLLAVAHMLLLIGLALRRRANGPAHDRRHALTLEHLPLLALTLLFAFVAFRANRLWAAERYTGAAPAAMQIEATGMQFAWYFRYPGRDAAFGQTDPALADPSTGNPVGIIPADSAGRDDITATELVLPVGREVDITLRATDVIHGFAIPELRVKQNAVPGQTQHIHFTATEPGTYAILCTQLCGLGHYRMQATLRVLPAEAFQSWLAAREAKR